MDDILNGLRFGLDEQGFSTYALPHEAIECWRPNTNTSITLEYKDNQLILHGYAYFIHTTTAYIDLTNPTALDRALNLINLWTDRY